MWLHTRDYKVLKAIDDKLPHTKSLMTPSDDMILSKFLKGPADCDGTPLLTLCNAALLAFKTVLVPMLSKKADKSDLEIFIQTTVEVRAKLNTLDLDCYADLLEPVAGQIYKECMQCDVICRSLVQMDMMVHKETNAPTDGATMVISISKKK